MRYLVFGTGAVGSYIGGRLALAGYETVFLARPQTAEALSKSGLYIAYGDQSLHLANPAVTTNLALTPKGSPPDAILLTVKAYDALDSARQIQQHLPGPPPIICFINGVGNEASLEHALGAGSVIPAILTSAVRKVHEGAIKVERKRGIGLSANHPLSRQIAHDFHNAGFHVRLYSSPDQMKWSKLITNLVGNASSAILGWTPGAVFANRGLYRLEIESLREAVRVMQQLGFFPASLPGVPANLLAAISFLPAWATQPLLRRLVLSGRGEKLPSFCYDIKRGRSEVQWLNGAVALKGTQLGIPTPANHVLCETLLGLIKGSIKPEFYKDQPTVLLEAAIRAGVPGIQV